jgi:hypothetical protein
MIVSLAKAPFGRVLFPKKNMRGGFNRFWTGLIEIKPSSAGGLAENAWVLFDLQKSKENQHGKFILPFPPACGERAWLVL